MTTLAETGQGIGGATQRIVARGSALTIGPYTLRDPIVALSQDPAQAHAKENALGLVGMEVLGRFKAIFDYSRKVLYLEPNHAVRNPFIYDASGLRLRASRPDFSPPFVSGIRDSSPALAAGIIVGDILQQIDDGATTIGMKLDVVRKKLKQPNQRHTLTLKRGSETIQVVMVTREMLK